MAKLEVRLKWEKGFHLYLLEFVFFLLFDQNMSSFQPDASHIVLLCLSRVAELEKNFFSICAWSPIGMVLHKGLLPLGDVGVDVGLLRRAVAPLPVLLGVHHQHRRCSSRSKDVSKKLRKNLFFSTTIHSSHHLTSDNQDEKDNDDNDDNEDKRVLLVGNGSSIDEHGELLFHFKRVARAYSEEGG